MSHTPYPLRLQWAWGIDEIAIVVSAEGIVPEGFTPDTSKIYVVKGEPETSMPQRLVRKAVEKYPVMAHAVIEHGVPNLLVFKNLVERPHFHVGGACSLGGGSSGGVN